MRSVRLRIVVAVVSLAALGVAGCGGTGRTAAGDDVQPDPAVRFVNSSPNAGALDFFLNEERQAATVQYLGSTQQFVRVPFISPFDDAYDVSVAPSAGGDEFDRVMAEFPRDTNTAVVAVGLPDPGAEFLKRLQLVFVSVPAQPLIGDRARLLIVHALVRSPGSDPIPVRLQTINPADPFSSDNPQFQTGQLLYATFGSTENTLELDSGPHTFQARRADVDGVSVLAQDAVTLGSGQTYLVLITGQEDVADPVFQPRLRFIELNPLD